MTVVSRWLTLALAITPPPPPLTHTHTLFLMLLLTFSLMSSYTPDEDTAQATDGHRVVRPAHGRGCSAKATLASSSSDKCRSDLKPGRGRGGRTSSRVGATSLTIGAVSEHSGRSHTFTHSFPHAVTHILTHVLLYSRWRHCSSYRGPQSCQTSTWSWS